MCRQTVTAGIVLAGLLLGPMACVIDTVPLPEEHKTAGSGNPGDAAQTPTAGGANSGAKGVAGGSLYFAAISPLATYLVGTPGALPGAGRIIITDASRNNTQEAFDTGADGSFAAVLGAAVGDSVQLSFEQNGIDVASLPVVIPSASVQARNAALALQGASLTVEPFAPNRVRVAGDPGLLPAGLTVVGTSSAGGTGSAAVAADGSFSLSLPATSGDVLWLFAVEPAASNGGGAPVSVTVP